MSASRAAAAFEVKKSIPVMCTRAPEGEALVASGAQLAAQAVDRIMCSLLPTLAQQAAAAAARLAWLSGATITSHGAQQAPAMEASRHEHH